MVPEKKRKKQCQQLSFKWSQSNVSAIDSLKLYSKFIQHRITFAYASVSVKCPQKPKFEKNWLAKDLTLGDKGLKFVIVRQKKTVFRAGFCEWWSWWRTIKKLRGCGNIVDDGISIEYPYFDANLIRLVHSILVSTKNPEKSCHHKSSSASSATVQSMGPVTLPSINFFLQKSVLNLVWAWDGDAFLDLTSGERVNKWF